MAKKTFTDESLQALVDQVKSYIDSAVSTKAESDHTHSHLPLVGGTLTGDLDVEANIATTGSFKIGDAVLTYDSSAGALVISFPDSITMKEGE